MNNFPAMHFPLGARGNNFDSQIKIIYSWRKRTPFASSGPFCACSIYIKNANNILLYEWYIRSLINCLFYYFLCLINYSIKIINCYKILITKVKLFTTHSPRIDIFIDTIVLVFINTSSSQCKYVTMKLPPLLLSNAKVRIIFNLFFFLQSITRIKRWGGPQLTRRGKTTIPISHRVNLRCYMWL